MTDRRRYPRHEVSDVQGTISFVAEARLLGLRDESMDVLTDSRLATGELYTVTLEAPGTEAIGIPGRVTHCHPAWPKGPDGSQLAGLFEAEVRFEQELPEAARRAVTTATGRSPLAFQKEVAGSFTRPEVVLGARLGFTVLTLSRGGMMIKTSLEPPLGHVFAFEVVFGDQLFRSRGRVLFVSPDALTPRTPLFRVGIAFLQPSPSNQEILDEFIGRRSGSDGEELSDD